MDSLCQYLQSAKAAETINRTEERIRQDTKVLSGTTFLAYVAASFKKGIFMTREVWNNKCTAQANNGNHTNIEPPELF